MLKNVFGGYVAGPDPFDLDKMQAQSEDIVNMDAGCLGSVCPMR